MTQVVAVDPILQLTASFADITVALEAHKTNKGSLVSAKEAETRAADALLLATSRSAAVKTESTASASSIVEAIDSATESLSVVRAVYAE